MVVGAKNLQLSLKVASWCLCVISLLHAKPYTVYSMALTPLSPLLFSEDDAKLGARRLARCLQKLGFKVKIIT